MVISIYHKVKNKQGNDTMQKETFNLYNDLAHEAKSLDEIVAAREMAASEEGSTEIKVTDETGQVEVINVKSIGAGTLAALDHAPVELAQASSDWHATDDK